MEDCKSINVQIKPYIPSISRDLVYELRSGQFEMQFLCF